MVAHNLEFDSETNQHLHRAIEADATSKDNSMNTTAKVKVVSISQAPSLDGSGPNGPGKDESWESFKEALQDAFVAGSTTELSQSELLLNQHGNTVRLIALRGNDLRFCPHEKMVLFYG